MSKTKQAGKREFDGLSREEVFGLFGGEQTRGAISKAILACLASGYSKMETANLLGKRYQHVRNVALEQARKNS